MKRASLKTAKVSVAQSPTGKDVTDRLLSNEESILPERKPRASAKKPRPRTREVKPMLQNEDEPLPYIPYRPVPDQPPMPPPGPTPQSPATPEMSGAAESIAQAVEKARAAVDTLLTAGRSAPAQYDLAVRYRLDALAHHLEQVAEFLARYA